MGRPTTQRAGRRAGDFRGVLQGGEALQQGVQRRQPEAGPEDQVLEILAVAGFEKLAVGFCPLFGQGWFFGAKRLATISGLWDSEKVQVARKKEFCEIAILKVIPQSFVQHYQ